MTDTAPSAGDQLHNLTDDLRALVRQEVRHGQAELAAKARHAAKGSMLLGAAGVCGSAAAAMSMVLLLRALERVMPPTAAAATAAGVLGAAAGALAARGLAELQPALPLLPEDTIADVRQDVQAAANR